MIIFLSLILCLHAGPNSLDSTHKFLDMSQISSMLPKEIFEN